MCDGVEMQNNRVWIVCLVRANDAHALMARKALCDWNNLLQPFLIVGHGARQRMLAENGRDRRIVDFVNVRNARNRSFLIGYHGRSLSVRWWGVTCDLNPAATALGGLALEAHLRDVRTSEVGARDQPCGGP